MFTAEIKIDNLSWRQLADAQDRHHRLAFFPVERAGEQSLAAKCYLQIGVGFDLAGEVVVNAKSRAEPRDWIGREQRRNRHRVKLVTPKHEGVRRFRSFRFLDQFRKWKWDPVQLRLMRIEKKFLFQRRDQNHIRFNSSLKIFQRGQRSGAVRLSAGKRCLKSVIARKDCCGARDLKIALLDQLFKNLCARAQTRFNLRERVSAIRSLNDEISDALHQRQKRDQKEEEPSSETTEPKFQRSPPVDNGAVLFARKSGFKSKVKSNSFDPSARSTCCASFSGGPFSDGCQTSMEYGPAGKSFRIARPSLPVT